SVAFIGRAWWRSGGWVVRLERGAKPPRSSIERTGGRSPLAAVGAASGGELLHYRRQLGRLDRLRHVRIEAAGERLHPHVGARMGGERDQGQSASGARSAGAKLASQVEAVLLRHREIAHDHVEWLPVEERDGFADRRGRGDLGAAALEKGDQ